TQQKVQLCTTNPPAKRGKPVTLTGAEVAALSPDGQTLAVSVLKREFADLNVKVKFLDVTTTDRAPTRESRTELAFGKNQTVARLAFAPDGKVLATAVRADRFASSPSQLHLWDLGTGKERTNFAARPQGKIVALVFAPDGTTVATADTQH